MARYKPPRRSRLQTMYEILTLSLNRMKKTHIMYKANLSHSQLEKFLKFLIEKNLLTVENNHYVTTEKGREFIKELRGDSRNEAVDIYDHIDRKELKRAYLAAIPVLGIF